MVFLKENFLYIIAIKTQKSIKNFVSIKQYSFPHCAIVIIHSISRDRKPTNLS